jgi:hypothetical protein
MQREHDMQPDTDPVSLALFKRDFFLMTLLAKFPWPPKAIYTCRIASPNPNIFEDEKPKDRPFALTPKLQEQFNNDPHVKFLQFYFDGSQTPNGRPVWGPVPEILIAPLLDFKDNHRENLIGAHDPGTLLLDPDFGALDHIRLGELVAKLTKKHADKPVSIWAIRESFCWMWLEENPGPAGVQDLARIMWVKFSTILGKFRPRSVLKHASELNSGRPW